MIAFPPLPPDSKLFQLARPKVTLKGESLEIGDVTWENPVGVEPGISKFVVDRERSKLWWPPAQGGEENDVASPFHAGDVGYKPITLSFEIPEVVRGTPRVFKETWRDVYVMERRILDRENALIIVADHRAYWNQSITASLNIPQRINDFALLQNGEELNIPGQISTEARFGVAEIKNGRRRPDGVIGNIITKQIRQPIRRYREWSLRRPFLGGAGGFFGDVTRPWTALQIAVAILRGREVFAHRTANGVSNPRWTLVPGILRDPEGLRFDGDVNLFSSYEPDRIEWQCKPIRDALREMLSLARAGIYVGIDGKVVIFPIDDDDPSQQGRIPGGVRSAQIDGAWLEVGSSFLEKLDNRAYRPSAVRCCFGRIHEIDLKASSEFFTAPDDLMINVCPAPAERFIADLGRTVAVNELVKVDFILRSYQTNVATVIKFWNMRGELAARIKENNGLARGIPDVEIDALVVNLQQTFRQLFKILDSWVDVLKSLSSSLVTVIDSNGKQSPGLVFAKYPVIPGFRLAREFLKDDQSQSAGWNVDATNTSGNPAPFFIQIEDEELGLLRVSPVGDNQNGDVYVNIPSGFEESEVDRIRAHITPSGADWGNVPLEEVWKITLRVSAEWFDPNDESRLFMIEVPSSSVFGEDEALSGPLEVFFDREPARFNHEGKLVNSEMLKAIAAAEAKRILHSHRDRWTAGPGGLKFGGGYRIRPWGSVSMVSWEWINGALSTRMQFSERVTPPTTQQSLERRLAYQLERRPPTQ